MKYPDFFTSIKQSIVVGFFLFAMTSSAFAELPDFTKLVEKHSAAVVNISTKQNNTVRKKFPDLNDEQSELIDELMKRFFDKDGSGLPPEKEGSSLGSGFIVSRDGYIVTNSHVISKADEIIVRLSDRRELSAKLIGNDKRSDVALLKVEAENLPVLETGSSKALKVGEWVVAIGSPFGFDHSVTAGIVSAKGRSLPSENYVPFIQTDVAINPGNSGGPLFNLKGEVVGINSQIFSRTGGFMGVSFAIPIDVANRVIEQLKEKGKVSRGWLGVYIQEVTRELAKSFSLKNPTGALIVNVIDEGPAKGILKQGDIVLEFDGKRIATASSLPVIVGSSPLGVDLDIKVRRGDSIENLTIKLAELPLESSANKEKKLERPQNKNKLLGMELMDLDEAVKESLEINKGVLVKNVVGDPAKGGGVIRGDIILMFKDEKVDNLTHLAELTSDLEEGKTYAILVLREGSARFLALKVDKPKGE